MRDFFKNDIGQYNPAAEEVSPLLVLRLVLEMIVVFFVPLPFFFLEFGAVSLDYDTYILTNDYPFRAMYYIPGVIATVCFIGTSLMSTRAINGRPRRLKAKKVFRAAFFGFFAIATVFYILACVYY